MNEGQIAAEQPMVDLEGCAQRVELVRAGRGALAQTEETIGELFSIVSQNCADAQRAGTLQVAQEATGAGGGLGLEYADEDPACRPVDCHEKIAA